MSPIVSKTCSIPLGGGRDSKTYEELIMKLIKLLCVAAFMMCASIAYADPAVIEIFDAEGSCIDEDGNFLLAQTVRRVVITNDDEGTVNLIIKGDCPTSSSSAVNFDSETFPVLIGCGAGSAGVVFFWKYTMRPDGKYTSKCSSNPLD